MFFGSLPGFSSSTFGFDGQTKYTYAFVPSGEQIDTTAERRCQYLKELSFAAARQYDARVVALQAAVDEASDLEAWRNNVAPNLEAVATALDAVRDVVLPSDVQPELRTQHEVLTEHANAVGPIVRQLASAIREAEDDDALLGAIESADFGPWLDTWDIELRPAMQSLFDEADACP